MSESDFMRERRAIRWRRFISLTLNAGSLVLFAAAFVTDKGWLSWIGYALLLAALVAGELWRRAVFRESRRPASPG